MNTKTKGTNKVDFKNIVNTSQEQKLCHSRGELT